jgi:hypothetical protein
MSDFIEYDKNFSQCKWVGGSRKAADKITRSWFNGEAATQFTNELFSNIDRIKKLTPDPPENNTRNIMAEVEQMNKIFEKDENLHEILKKGYKEKEEMERFNREQEQYKKDQEERRRDLSETHSELEWERKEQMKKWKLDFTKDEYDL